MKKKIRASQVFLAFAAFFIVLAILSALADWSYKRSHQPQEPISYEDNCQLNEIEQYHRSQGRNIQFPDDIFPN